VYTAPAVQFLACRVIVLPFTNQKYKRRIIKLNFEQRFFYNYASASTNVTCQALSLQQPIL
jgi:hypothetical protein